jgi:hypothetical protein
MAQIFRSWNFAAIPELAGGDDFRAEVFSLGFAKAAG